MSKIKKMKAAASKIAPPAPVRISLEFAQGQQRILVDGEFATAKEADEKARFTADFARRFLSPSSEIAIGSSPVYINHIGDFLSGFNGATSNFKIPDFDRLHKRVRGLLEIDCPSCGVTMTRSSMGESFKCRTPGCRASQFLANQKDKEAVVEDAAPEANGVIWYGVDAANEGAESDSVAVIVEPAADPQTVEATEHDQSASVKASSPCARAGVIGTAKRTPAQQAADDARRREQDAALARTRLLTLACDGDFLRELSAVAESPSAKQSQRIEFTLRSPRGYTGYTAGVPDGKEAIATAVVQDRFWRLTVPGCDESRVIKPA